MDKQKYLVIIKGEDRTEDVLKYQSDKNYIHVRYRNISIKIIFHRYFCNL